MQVVLRRGERGQFVRQLQAALGVAVDGTFGPRTEASVRAFQAAHGLGVDGVAGSATLGALGIVPIEGVDLSHWQRRVDCDKLAASTRFVYLKATHGAGGVDRTFAARRRALLAAGVPVGAYAFAVPQEHDPIAEAEHLLRTVGKVGKGELVPALDLEKYTTGMSAEQIVEWARRWLEHVEQRVGRAPLLYTGTLYVNGRFGRHGDRLARFPLWFARYRGDGYLDPGPIGAWQRWAIWQYTGSGSVDGVVGRVDRDVLAGGEHGLDELRVTL